MRQSTKRDLQAYALMLAIVALLVGWPLLALAAYGWEWKCLIVECRKMVP